jgi:hypothetical protein
MDKIFLVKITNDVCLKEFQDSLKYWHISMPCRELTQEEIELLKGLIRDEIYYKENHELTKGQFKFVYDRLKELLRKLEGI